MIIGVCFSVIALINTICNRIKLEQHHYFIYTDTVVNKNKEFRELYFRKAKVGLKVSKKEYETTNIDDEYYLISLKNSKYIISGFKKNKYYVDESLLTKISVSEKIAITHEFCCKNNELIVTFFCIPVILTSIGLIHMIDFKNWNILLSLLCMVILLLFVIPFTTILWKILTDFIHIIRHNYYFYIDNVSDKIFKEGKFDNDDEYYLKFQKTGYVKQVNISQYHATEMNTTYYLLMIGNKGKLKSVFPTNEYFLEDESKIRCVPRNT